MCVRARTCLRVPPPVRMHVGAGRPFAVFFGRSALLRRYSAADARRKLIVVRSATPFELSDANSAQPIVEELLYSKSAVAHACPKPLKERSSRAETNGFSNGLAAMAVGSKSTKSSLAGGVLSFSTRITLTARRQLSLVGESVAKAIGFRGAAEFEVDEAVDSEDTKLFYVVLLRRKAGLGLCVSQRNPLSLAALSF